MKVGTSGGGTAPSASRSCVLEVRVSPNSRRNDVRLEEGTIRIRVGAAPEDGRALATALGLRRPAVNLEAGATSRTKRFRVVGLDESEALRRLTG